MGFYVYYDTPNVKKWFHFFHLFTNPMMILPGYNIQENLYESDFSIICRAFQEKQNLPVILKISKHISPTSEKPLKSQHEYEIIQKFRNDGVIKAYGFELINDLPVLILEDIAGESLTTIIDTRELNLEDFLTLAIRITDIIGNIHQQNIIHKDINPSNIIWNPDEDILKIIDFCISTELSREVASVKNPDILEGTLLYISPEQTGRMNRAVDYRTDYYSLGITLYRMLTGGLPFESSDAMELIHCHIAKQPRPPHVAKPQIPEQLSHIIMKLMAKNAEDRYQSANGLITDLERCRADLLSRGTIKFFIPGEKDFSDKFQIPEKLYGRDPEVNTLISGFERVCHGTTELILVSGFPGTGKSALVNEIHKPVVKYRGNFISGKYDKFKQDIPYSAIIQAFGNLINQLLTENKKKGSAWKKRLRHALGPNGQVIIDVIPQLELIIGLQEPVPELGQTETENRFNVTFQNFISVFIDKNHPLAMFLDDLQWADLASIEFLKSLLINLNSKHLLLIGSYRSNDITQSHPYTPAIEEIKKAGLKITTIHLQPLSMDHIQELLKDTLNSSMEKVSALAAFLLHRTEGNPYFINEFLKSLHQDGALEYIPNSGWTWDIQTLEQMQIDDNIVDLLLNKISTLPEDAKELLMFGACFGSYFELEPLILLFERPITDIQKSLTTLLREGLVIKLENQYRFAHDHIRDAVYSLIPDKIKKEHHYRIGNLKLKNVDDDTIHGELFFIVNQLNAGIDFISGDDEKRSLSKLNYMAGKKARISAAYESACEHLKIALSLSNDNDWTTHYDDTLSVYHEALKASQLCTDYTAMEGYAETVLKHAKTFLDKVIVYETRISACMAQNHLVEGINIGLSVLKKLGIMLPKNPTKVHVYVSVIKTKIALMGKPVEAFGNLPEMKDPYKLAAMKIITKVIWPAYFARPNLAAMLSINNVRLSLKYGISPFGVFSYVGFGIVLCGILEDMETGYRIGKTALHLVQKLNIREYKARILTICYHLIFHWKKPLKEILAPLREVYQVGIETGDFEYAGCSAMLYIMDSFLAGKNLMILKEEVNDKSSIFKKFQHDSFQHFFTIQHQTILNLLGLSDNPCNITGDIYNENEMLPIHKKAKDQTALSCYYHHKLYLNYLFENYEDLHAYVKELKLNEDGALSSPAIPDYYYIYSLACMATYKDANWYRQKWLRLVVAKNQWKLKKWMKYAPENISHKYHLVEAEKARILGKVGNAIHHYEQAIDFAHKHGFINDEALATELTARFFLELNKTDIAAFYMVKAHDTYSQWGARAKVSHLEQTYPQLLNMQRIHRKSSDKYTVSSSAIRLSELDLATVIKSSQTISSEIILAKLLEKMMRIVIENAGAQIGYLILQHHGKLYIEAEASVEGSDVAVRQSIPVENCPNLALSIINYVERTKKSVVLNDAVNHGEFTSDRYIIENQSQSILAAPLINQGNFMGILYLENSLTTHAFTPDRITFFELLASQAAISLENANLYEEITNHRNNLENIVNQRTAELEAAQKELMEKAHKAGMADIAVNVLHNFGNILNSVKISAQLLNEINKNSQILGFKKANTILKENMDRLEEFITSDPKGKKLLTYYLKIEETIDQERNTVNSHLHRLMAKVNELEKIVTAQQEYVETDSSVVMEHDLRDIVEEVLTIKAEETARQHITVTREYHDVSKINLKKTKLIYILTNLIKNADDAMCSTPPEKKALSFVVNRDTHAAYIKVTDNGKGIPQDAIKKIFNHGYSTRPDGQGFGLHSSANYMTEMGGKMWAESDGEDKGATFILKFPVESGQ